MSENDKTRSIARELISGGVARTVSLILARFLSFVKIVVFARLFLPEEIGTVWLVLTIVAFASGLGEFGFYHSIIRSKKEISRTASTAFSLSLLITAILAALLLLIAPIFSYILNAELTNYIRFSVILIAAVPLMFPKILLEKELKFLPGSLTLVIIEATSLLVAVCIHLLFHSGVWALLVGNMAGLLIASIYLWNLGAFRPSFTIDREVFSSLFSFGWPYMLQGINSQAMSKADNLIVNLHYGLKSLAFYNFAWQMPMMISQFASQIDHMLYPVYVRFAQDERVIRRLFNLSCKMWSIFGVLFGLPFMLFSEEIVQLLFGDKWFGVAPLLRIMSISFVVRFCTGYAYDNIVLLRGRTRYILKWGVVNTVFILSIGWLMIWSYGPIGGAWFWVLQAIVLIPVMRFPIILQELGTLEFMLHIWQPVVAGILSAVITFYVVDIFFVIWYVRLIVGMLIYVSGFILLLSVIDRNLIHDVQKLYFLAREK